MTTKPGMQPDNEVKSFEYGMKTEAGSTAIKAIILAARKRDNKYSQGNEKEKSALAFLRALAKKEGYEEANSEEVRTQVLKEVRKR